MADNFNTIKVIQIFDEDGAKVNNNLDISDFRTVGSLSLQYDISGAEMTICYSISLDGTEFFRQENTNLVFNETGKGLITFEMIVARYIRFESFGTGTVSAWLGIQ